MRKPKKRFQSSILLETEVSKPLALTIKIQKTYQKKQSFEFLTQLVSILLLDEKPETMLVNHPK